MIRLPCLSTNSITYYSNPAAHTPIASILCYDAEAITDYAMYHHTVMPGAALVSVLLHGLVLALFLNRKVQTVIIIA